MECTGHSSKEGVRAYKRVTTKLSDVTFDILNSDHINTSTTSEVTSKPTDSNLITSEPTTSKSATVMGTKDNKKAYPFQCHWGYLLLFLQCNK